MVCAWRSLGGLRSRQPAAPREALPFSKASPRHERWTIHSPPRYTAALHLRHRQETSFFLSLLLVDSQGIEYPLLPSILHRPAAARPLARIPELELREDAPALLATPEAPSSSPPPTAIPPPSHSDHRHQRPPLRHQPIDAHHHSRRVATQRQHALRLIPRAAYARSPLPANRSSPRLALEPCQHSCPTFDNITSAAAHHVLDTSTNIREHALQHSPKVALAHGTRYHCTQTREGHRAIVTTQHCCQWRGAACQEVKTVAHKCIAHCG